MQSANPSVVYKCSLVRNSGILLTSPPFSPHMDGASHHARKKKHAGALILSTVCAAGLWVLFVSSSISPHEILLGAACVIATVVFTFFTARTMGVRFGLRLRDFAEGWRIPWYIVSDLVSVTVLLIEDTFHIGRAENLFRVCGFDTSKHDPVRVARTVLAIAYSTCSPNCIVIGIDQTQSRMLFHQLRRSNVPIMTKRLGAKG